MEIRTNELRFTRLTIANAKDSSDFSVVHDHNFYELILFESGDADYVVEGRRYPLKKNDLIVTRPLTYHYIAMRSNVDYKRFLIGFQASILDQALLNSLPDDIEVVNCPEHSIIHENFERLYYYSKTLTKEQFLDLFPSLLKEILYNLVLSKSDVVHIPSEISPILSRALAYINENLYSLKDLKEIAEHLFISTSYLFKLFKQQLRISPKQYVQLKRLHLAKSLLAHGKKPSAVYAECGFDSYIGFYKQYVKCFGHPPSQEKS